MKFTNNQTEKINKTKFYNYMKTQSEIIPTSIPFQNTVVKSRLRMRLMDELVPLNTGGGWGNIEIDE